MKVSINRPEIVCWIAIPVILLIGLMTINKTLDMQLHDTYFVISNLHLGIFFGLILGLTGLGYWIVSKMNGDLLKSLSWLHLTLTIGGFLLIMILTSLIDSSSEMNRDYKTYEYLNGAIGGALIGFILIQPIYLINLIIGFYRRKNKAVANHKK